MVTTVLIGSLGKSFTINELRVGRDNDLFLYKELNLSTQPPSFIGKVDVVWQLRKGVSELLKVIDYAEKCGVHELFVESNSLDYEDISSIEKIDRIIICNYKG